MSQKTHKIYPAVLILLTVAKRWFGKQKSQNSGQKRNLAFLTDFKNTKTTILGGSFKILTSPSTQRRSYVSQQLLQQNTTEKMIFEGATVQRKLLITQINRKLSYFLNFYTSVTSTKNIAVDSLYI